MPIPGTVPVTGAIAPTATGDTYATLLETYKEGGYRSVADNTERDAISVARRKEGMLVYSIAAGIIYQLAADLTTWNTFNPSLPSDVMLKCFHPSTEILTKDGWKYVEQITMEDWVMTLNPDTQQLEYQQPTNLFEYEYEGELLGRKSTQLNYLVTPNHRFYVKQWLAGGNPYKVWGEKYVWEDAKHVSGKIRAFPLTGKWEGSRLESKFGIEGDLFIKFMAWYLSEGFTHKNRITISQVTKVELVNDLVNECAKSLGVNPVVHSKVNFGFCHGELAAYTKQFGTSKFKYVPDEIKKCYS